MDIELIGFVAVIASGLSALVSAVTAFLALRSAKSAQHMLEQKGQTVPSGPDVEDVATETPDVVEGEQ